MILVIDHHETSRTKIHYDAALGNHTDIDTYVQGLHPNIQQKYIRLAKELD